MSERKINIASRMHLEASGHLDVHVVDRAGRAVDWRSVPLPVNPHPNTVLKGAYQALLLLATGLLPTGDVKYFALGTNPAPSSWEMTTADCNLSWWSPLGRLTRTADLATMTMTFGCLVGYDEGNGGGVASWYEAALVPDTSPSYRIFARVAFRDGAGAPAPLTKHDEYKVQFNWQITWGATIA